MYHFLIWLNTCENKKNIILVKLSNRKVKLKSYKDSKDD
jgi:hypothetical protein